MKGGKALTRDERWGLRRCPPNEKKLDEPALRPAQWASHNPRLEVRNLQSGSVTYYGGQTKFVSSIATKSTEAQNQLILFGAFVPFCG
jgi:hypothetical protein